MIRDVVLPVEEYFKDNWVDTQIHYEDTEFKPTDTEWIHLQIVPTTLKTISPQGCMSLLGAVIVTAYGKNKVKAGEVMDIVTTFLANKKIDTVGFSGGELISSGSLDSSFYYKVAFRFKKGE